MKPTAFGRTVRRRLEAQARPDVRRNYEWYFKGAVRFLGLKTPAIRRVAREVEPLLRDRPAATIVNECFRLLHSPYAEEKYIAISVLGRHVRRLPATFLADLEPVVDSCVHDWGTCDHLAGHVLHPRMMLRPADRRTLVRWRLASHPWRQRAVAVAFVHEARHGHCTREVLTVCRALVRCPDRFVQLGMGWVLRELSLADRQAVVDFLAANYASVNREALRYAVEKLPVSLRSKVLAEHTRQRVLSRRRG